MKIRRTNSFKKDYRGLPEDIRNRVDKQLHYLVENPRHPSLRLKKLKGTDKFEIRISKGFRMTFQYADQILELRRIGTHDVLRKEGS
ncbi:type II toxin-antitoxin system YafQ family toxin [Thermodesulfobacteriota bacterium]